jgi:hypothetical protein
MASLRRRTLDHTPTHPRPKIPGASSWLSTGFSDQKSAGTNEMVITQGHMRRAIRSSL